jgi:carbon storage regulator CsrA
MLVLTRKYQEKIRIGNDITITVLRTKGKAVRLGIEAPPTVPVIRGELKFESEAAAQESEPVLAAARPSTGQRESYSESAWTTKSRSGSSTAGRARTAVQVGHRRVPRENMPELLPQLLSSGGPLRAIMEQRSASA